MDSINKATAFISSIFGGAETQLSDAKTTVNSIANKTLGQSGIESTTKLRFKVRINAEDLRTLDEQAYADLWSRLGNSKEGIAALLSADTEEVTVPKQEPKATFIDHETGQILSEAEHAKLMEEDFPRAMGMDIIQD